MYRSYPSWVKLRQRISGTEEWVETRMTAQEAVFAASVFNPDNGTRYDRAVVVWGDEYDAWPLGLAPQVFSEVDGLMFNLRPFWREEV